MHAADLPLVFLSYDEPWADAAWEKARALSPRALRVHGITGLDASHKAAAKAAGTRFFFTLDADTELRPSFQDLEIDDRFLSDDARLSWHSRNRLNGLVSGNGSLKLWPSRLVQRMKTHEAAEAGTISLDHDVSKVSPGKTQSVVLPGIHSETDPARTPYHAFRAGFREATHLAHHIPGVIRALGADDPRVTALSGTLTVWGSVGRHHQSGLFAIYGARLALWLAAMRPGHDPRAVNDYGGMGRLWDEWVQPRYLRPAPPGRVFVPPEPLWNLSALEEETAALGRLIAERTGRELPDLSPGESRVLAEAGIFPAFRTADPIDALGYALLKGRGFAAAPEAARDLFAAAAQAGHAGAAANLARMAAPAAGGSGESQDVRTVPTLGDLPWIAVGGDGRELPVAPAAVVPAGDSAALTAALAATGAGHAVVVPQDVRVEAGEPGLILDDALLAAGVELVFCAVNEVTGLCAVGRGLRVVPACPEGPRGTLVLPRLAGRWAPADRTEALRAGVEAFGDLAAKGAAGQARLEAMLGADHPLGAWWQEGFRPPTGTDPKVVAAAGTDGTSGAPEGNAGPSLAAATARALRPVVTALPPEHVWRTYAEALWKWIGDDGAMAQAALRACATFWPDAPSCRTEPSRSGRKRRR